MTTLAFLVVALITTPETIDFAKLKWEPLTITDGVDVSRCIVPNSGIMGVRGIATVDVHIGKIYELFRTVPRQPEWVNRLKETRVFSKPEESSVRYYSRYHSPWPISDRDFVFQRELKIEEDKKRVTVIITSVEDERMPEKDCCVRGWLSRGYWRFTAQEGGKTLIEVEVITDPKGYLPNWLINLVQRNWPVKSIAGLASRAAEPDIRRTPEYAEW